MWVYINYPEPKFSIHHSSSCKFIPPNKNKKKENQRRITVNKQNLRDVLKDFRNDKYPFSSTSSKNDMWIDINLVSPQENEEFFYKIREILEKKYGYLTKAKVKVHCRC